MSTSHKTTPDPMAPSMWRAESCATSWRLPPRPRSPPYSTTAKRQYISARSSSKSVDLKQSQPASQQITPQPMDSPPHQNQAVQGDRHEVLLGPRGSTGSKIEPTKANSESAGALAPPTMAITTPSTTHHPITSRSAPHTSSRDTAKRSKRPSSSHAAAPAQPAPALTHDNS
jgi:hypothetical protein